MTELGLWGVPLAVLGGAIRVSTPLRHSSRGTWLRSTMRMLPPLRIVTLWPTMRPGTTGEQPMSVQPPAAPHRVAIADVDIPFWRMVAIIIKWAFASIPAIIIISIIFAILGAVVGAVVAMLGLSIPSMKL
jgi:hypothetical protein